MEQATIQNTGTGMLQFRSYTASEAYPVPDVQVTVTFSDGTRTQLSTGSTALSQAISISCPPKALSLEPQSTTLPYATCDIHAEKQGYLPVDVKGVQIFDTITSLQPLDMIPSVDQNGARLLTEPLEDTLVPVHKLFAGGPSSGQSPIMDCRALVLSTPVIPNKITVHLGRPAASAQNVTVSFRDYIKNVASSEIYPTWPEQALRANIHAQISLALNRVFTEWYKSKGYNFQITNSTSYDQYYVHGRDIFEPMDRIVDEIFNTYVRRPGTIDPYFTEYCDGKSVTCRGMKQWGTVTLAESGKTALEILKYYYGNNLEIVRTDNIADIPESYPGTPLRIGSTGDAVRTIQRQLNRISKDYPSFGTLEVDGVYGQSTADVVKKFQKQVGLTQDGVGGRSSWYQISYIYVAVKKLAELTSEGEQPTGGLVSGTFPGTLRVGSTGDTVEQVQFWLNTVADYVPSIPKVNVDGIFGAATQAAVRAFQTHYGLTVDGIVGRATWDTLYGEYRSIQEDVAPPGVTQPGQYPGTPLRTGSRGNEVKQMQFYLRIIARSNKNIPSINADGIFGAATQAAVRAFQSAYGLSVDGVVGPLTWDKIYEVYTDLINGLLTSDQRPGVYPGTPLRVDSTGRAVKEVQYYLYLLSAYFPEIPVIAYDGVFGAATEKAVRAYQQLFGLTVDGIVGRATWDSIYQRFTTLRNVDGPMLNLRVLAYPGYDLQEGSQGEIVKFVQFMLAYIGVFYDPILPIDGLTGVYGPETAASVRSFQQEFSLPQTGVMDETTWNTMVIIYLSLAADPTGVDRPVGEYPGYVLAFGSAGSAVLELQQFMSEIASRFCAGWFVPENGIVDETTYNAVKEFQKGFGLPVTGLVDRLTWDTIYDYYLMEE